MERVFVDANVLLELFFERARYDQAVVCLKQQKDRILCISVLSADIFMYFVEIEKASKEKAWSFLSSYKMLDMNEADISWANANDCGDFEDAMQTACALRHSCEKLVTLDKQFAKHYGQHIVVETIS